MSSREQQANQDGGWFRDWASYIDAKTLKYGIWSNAMDIYASSPSPRSRFRNPLETSGLPISFKTTSMCKTRSHLHPTAQESEQAPSCNKIKPTHHWTTPPLVIPKTPVPGNPAMADPGAFAPIGTENDLAAAPCLITVILRKLVALPLPGGAGHQPGLWPRRSSCRPRPWEWAGRQRGAQFPPLSLVTVGAGSRAWVRVQLLERFGGS